MRICLVSQEYPPDTAHGGIATQTEAKARGLAARGHRVQVVSHSLDARRHEYREGGVDIVRIPSADDRLTIRSDAVRWISHSENVAAELDRLQGAAPFDLIDFPEWGCEAYIHLLNRAPDDPARVVIHLHGPLVMFARQLGWPEPDSPLYEVGDAMERTCLRLADGIFSSSGCSADWAAREHGLDREKIPVLHTGIDLSLFRPLERPPGTRPTLLFVGRIARSKGADRLVEAALAVAAGHPDLRLRLIGRDEGGLAARLVERAHSAGYPDLVEIAGFRSAPELPAELAGADIFVAPSPYEGGPGFVYLEAMACGVPVIACTGSGAAEVVRAGENGLLVPPDDVAALACALRRLLGDADERARMGRAALQFARREADREICLDRIEAWYRAIVERR